MKLKNKIKVDVLSMIIAIIASLLLIGLDQLTKYLVSHNETLLSGNKIMVIKHFISFLLTYNDGAAWSILSGKKVFLVTISCVASIICFTLIVLTASFKNKKLYTIALILITAGASGNLIDRAFFSKGVIDFLNFEFINFPVFNVADSMLTCGAVVLAVYLLFFETKEEKKEDTNNVEDSDNNDQIDS